MSKRHFLNRRAGNPKFLCVIQSPLTTVVDNKQSSTTGGFTHVESVTTGKAGGLKDCEPLKAVYSTDSLTTIRWSTI
jgi:hypothetical protein